MKVRVLGACLSAALLISGCELTTEWNPAQLADGKTDPAVRKLEMGRETYATYCVGCHGTQGDGAGPAARFLDPKPRDFRSGRLKFASVESGAAPRDEDYMKTITDGLAGTAMPSFALLTSTEREALIAYVKSFRKKAETSGDRLPLPKDPFAGNAAAGEQAGEQVYHQFVKCWSCHPSYATPSEMTKWAKAANTVAPPLRPNAYESETKDSEWGAPIRAPDFLQDRVKTGFAPDSLARVIGSGIGGTAMPTWGAMLKPDQLWGLAYYVRKIALMRGTREAAELRKHLAAEPPPPPSKSKDDEE
jgi:cytochrome c oxidase cbb3-type subunit I/II